MGSGRTTPVIAAYQPTTCRVGDRSYLEVDRSLAVFADVLRAHARRPAIPQRRDPVRLAEAAESPE
jgi:hypothetical protein